MTAEFERPKVAHKFDNEIEKVEKVSREFFFGGGGENDKTHFSYPNSSPKVPRSATIEEKEKSVLFDLQIEAGRAFRPLP